MAQIEHFIPFILRWAAGVTQKPGETVTALFERAKKTGWSDDPLDSGGATQCDVTIATYRDYCRNHSLPAPTKITLRAIPYTHWHDILKTMYWDRCKADQITNQAVAEIIVDWLWASGGTAIRQTQQLLGCTPDGIVGPKTLSAINAQPPAELFNRLHAARVQFCKNIVARRPSQSKWLRGWLNRINAIPRP